MRSGLRKPQSWGWMRQITAGLVEFLSLLSSASDPWGTGADLAEAASDGKHYSLTVARWCLGEELGRLPAVSYSLILLVSTHTPWAVGICKIQS